MRRRTDYIVVHCSATPPSSNIGADEIRQWHMSPPRNWKNIGYHIVIRRDGTIEFGRHLDADGAHTLGYNTRSVGVCLVGGISQTDRKSEFNYTPAQLDSLKIVLQMLHRAYPQAEVLGHRDLSPDLDGDGIVSRHEWVKDCPCFDVRSWVSNNEVLS
jgi:N-acetylmuramoyl-L-alanine amidase